MPNDVWVRELEARVSALERDVRGLRRELSDVILEPLLREVGEIKTLVRHRSALAGSAESTSTGEDRHITMRDVVIAGGAIALTCTVLKFLHLLG